MCLMKKIEGKTKHEEWQSAKKRRRKRKGGEGIIFFGAKTWWCTDQGKIASVSSDLLDRVSSLLLYDYQPQAISWFN